MPHIDVTLHGKVHSVPAGTTAYDLFAHAGVDTNGTIAVLVNRRLKSLHYHLSVSTDVSPVDLTSSLGHKVYRKSLCFLLLRACRILFPEVRLRIGPSMGNAYLFSAEEGSPFSAERCASLEAEIRKLIEADLPILPVKLSYSDALSKFSGPDQVEDLTLIQQKNEAVTNAISCADSWDLEHFPLAPRTGCLQTFAVAPDPEGLLLHFPEKQLPLKMKPIERKKVLLEVSAEYREWGDILGIPSIPRLNQIASNPKEIAHFIQVAETLQEKKIGNLADQIAQKRDKLKVVLIAGPSSSGKTTFTKKLAIHLQVLGFKPRMISLDDYFVNRDVTPKDKDGNYDFEALEALDVRLLNEHLVDLLAGREVQIPTFDFKTGQRKAQGTPMRMQERDILMMEGIHGLNDALTPLIPAESKFKIYISALTALDLDGHNRISTTDNRLIRRLVRDFQFRGYSALHTLRQWPLVRRGEDKNIFPFQESADGVFNSALDYELAVLKEIAVPLLRTVPPTESEYTTADYLISFLHNFIPISALHVPTFSILREFVGNSGFKY